MDKSSMNPTVYGKESGKNINLKNETCVRRQSKQQTLYASASSSATFTTPNEQYLHKNRRGHVGSGQTISQLTKDRLKNMITSKMNNKTQGNTDGSSYHTTNMQSTAYNSSVISQSATGKNSGSSQCDDIKRSLSHRHVNNLASSISSSHYEPYPSPSTMSCSQSSSLYQLRKVNSEPNLKMKLRAKLLTKGSSPVQFIQNSAFALSSQSRSHGSDILMDINTDSTTSVEHYQQTSPQPLLASAPLLMIPSPSLPNLTFPEQFRLEMSALLSQAISSPYFSMPSLERTNVVPPSLSIYDQYNGFDSTSRQSLKFDTRTLSSPLPLGGYPSLLKQQLRDLVLRRKSLVREEPDEEIALNSTLVPKTPSGQAGSGSPMLPGNANIKTGLIYDISMSRHQCLCGDNNNHVEHGGRVQSIWSKLIENGLVDMCERVNSRKASLDLLKTVHSPTYVTFFAVSPTACLKMEPAQLPVRSFVRLSCGGIGVDSDTYFNDSSTQTAARLAAGCLVELVIQVAEGKIRNGFACIRPPGHHSECNQAMGFCFFNNTAIAARFLQNRYRDSLSRIAIIDWDVHHGNGIQLCFEADPSVLYISLHRHDNGNFFPGTGAVTEVGIGAGKGFTVNLPFAGEAMDDADYLAAWRVIVIPILDEFKPDFILVSAGFDAARGHSQALGGYNLSPQLFGHFTQQLMCFASGKLVLALEGGYDLPGISECASECVKALCDHNFENIPRLSNDALLQIPKQTAQDAIHKVIATQKKYWPSLSLSQGIDMSELHWQTVSHRFAALTV